MQNKNEAKRKNILYKGQGSTAAIGAPIKAMEE